MQTDYFCLNPTIPRFRLRHIAPAQTATNAPIKPHKAAKQNVEVTADGNFKAIQRATSATTAEPTDKTYTDRTGKVYPVYKTDKGRYFVNKVSGKTGKEYRYYLVTK